MTVLSFWRDVVTHVYSRNPPWMNQHLKKCSYTSKFIILYVSELTLAARRIISKTLIASDKWQQYKGGEVVLTQARGHLSWFVFVFFIPSVLSSMTQLWCIQSLSLLECFTGRVLLWLTSTFQLGKSESMHAAPDKVSSRLLLYVHESEPDLWKL